MKVKGIKLYRFIAPKELYLSGDVYEANKGFCVPSDSCLPTGLLNISRCQPQSKLHNKVAPRNSEIFCLASFPGSLSSLESWERERRENVVCWFLVKFVGGVMCVIYRRIYIYISLLLGLGGRARRVLSRLFSRHIILG